MQIDESHLNQIDRLIDRFQDEDVADTLLSRLPTLNTIDRSTPQPLITRAVELLDRLDNICDQKPLDERIHQLRSSSFHAKRNLSKLIHSKGLVPLNICCDFREDYNGVLAITFNEALKNNQPVIVTRSILTGAGIESNKNQHVNEMKQTVLETHRNYRIFRQNDAEWGDEFLVFLPCRHAIMPDDYLLNSYDLHPSLKRTSPHEAFSGPEGGKDINALKALFIENPKHPKVISISGHGDKELMAGMKREDYSRELLPFLKEQKTQFLLVNSCSSGGTQSLLHFDQEMPYPIAVCSVGDYSTSGDRPEIQLTQKIFRRVFRQLKINPGIKKSQVEKIARTAKKSRPLSENQIKMLLPGSTEAPKGFEPLHDQSNDVSITFKDLRKHQFESGGPIKLRTNRGSLILSPLILPVPIILEGNDPCLLSALPGKSHHWVESLTLPNVPLMQFFSTNGNYAKIMTEEKAYIFEKLLFKDIELKEVLLIQCNSQLTAFFENEGTSYLYQNQSLIPISTLLRKQLSLAALQHTLPSQETLKRGVAGQEERETVIDQCRKKWKEDVERIESLKTKSHIDRLSEEEASIVLLAAVENHDISRTKEILRAFPKLILTRNERGVPLVFQLVKFGDREINQMIIDAEIDLSIVDPESHLSLFSIFLKNGDVELVRTILEIVPIALDRPERTGWPPIHYALDHPDMVELLLKAGASPFAINRLTGETLIL